jgi:hypothetical protein
MESTCEESVEHAERGAPGPGAEVGGVSPVPAKVSAGASAVLVQMWAGCARSRCRCGQARTRSLCRCGGDERGPGADVGGASPVPVQMWAGASAVPVQVWQRRARSRCRCGRGGRSTHWYSDASERASVSSGGSGGADSWRRTHGSRISSEYPPCGRRVCTRAHTHTRAHTITHSHTYVACSRFHVACCSPHVERCMMHVASCPLQAARCMSHAAAERRQAVAVSGATNTQTNTQRPPIAHAPTSEARARCRAGRPLHAARLPACLAQGQVSPAARSSYARSAPESIRQLTTGSPRALAAASAAGGARAYCNSYMSARMPRLRGRRGAYARARACECVRVVACVCACAAGFTVGSDDDRHCGRRHRCVWIRVSAASVPGVLQGYGGVEGVNDLSRCAVPGPPRTSATAGLRALPSPLRPVPT